MSVIGENRLDLLLAFADELRPVLDEGLPTGVAESGPRPKKAVRGDDSNGLERVDVDANDLPAQRWAVIAPEGREGSRMLEAISPLIRLREEEQGHAPAIVWRVPSGMDAKQVVDWKDKVLRAEGLEDDDRPFYLLLLGDLHQVSAEFQHSLGHGSLAGRVHFTDETGETDFDGYAAYAEKVVRFARQPTAETAPDLLFYCSRDGSAATAQGSSRLVAPSLEAAQRNRESGRLDVASVREIEADSVGALLEAAKGPRPSVLLSVSHGLGAPRSGWKSEEEQWRRQGGLVLGRNEVLDAERIRGQTFLPGGLWFCLACFGAGTPDASAYKTWLSKLAETGAYRGAASSVLASLPKAGERPFVAAMPQAALRNPNGPLAVMGHLDLAWSYSFSSAKNLAESRASRITTALDAMARGSRAGVALFALMRYYRETNDTLMSMYTRREDASAERRPDPIDPAELAHYWMLRNDLRGYVLLGDPAVRLPIARNAFRTIAPKPQNTSPADVSVKVAAVHALFRGTEPPLDIATRAGATLDELWAWWDAYRAGGRERLGG
jgi:hypothetical protein